MTGQGTSPSMAIRSLGLTDYDSTWLRMRQFTTRRTPETRDEIWCTEHQPVFTLGKAGSREHIRKTCEIPVVHCDRGGQITYHGPGQCVVYILMDLKRAKLGVKQFVSLLEQAVIDLLAEFSVVGQRKFGAPGVYVKGAKIAQLGIRVCQGCAYHGVAMNVSMDLSPFTMIDPCGYPELEVTQLDSLGIRLDVDSAGEKMANRLSVLLTTNRSGPKN